MENINKKIYILHGWTYSLDRWSKFSNLLKKNGFETVFLNIPGLTKESNEVWDIVKYSKWLEKILSKEKGKVILIGHSNGGRIASYYTAVNPRKVERLILVDSAGIYHKDLFIRAKRFIFRNIAGIGKKFTDSKFLKKLLYRVAGEKDYSEASDNMKRSMINLINVDLESVFRLIKTDTLIIWGREDKITPLSDAIQINKLVKKSKLHIIEGARHSPFFTHPKKVIEIIKNDI